MKTFIEIFMLLFSGFGAASFWADAIKYWKSKEYLWMVLCFIGSMVMADWFFSIIEIYIPNL